MNFKQLGFEGHDRQLLQIKPFYDRTGLVLFFIVAVNMKATDSDGSQTLATHKVIRRLIRHLMEHFELRN